MTLRKYATSFLVLLSTILGLVVAPAAHATLPTPKAQVECEKPFYQGNPLLGPQDLPGPGHLVGQLLKDYNRIGNKPNVEAFLREYVDDNGRWRYPSNDGFDGTPTSKKLRPGEVIDRFGGQSGRFLAPVGTQFKQRSLPPQSLNTCEYEKGVKMPYGYYRYKVEKEIPVFSGSSAKWFGQPGGGIQYKIDGPRDHNVGWLVQNRYLSIVK
jgi:hypothetical protein